MIIILQMLFGELWIRKEDKDRIVARGKLRSREGFEQWKGLYCVYRLRGYRTQKEQSQGQKKEQRFLIKQSLGEGRREPKAWFGGWPWVCPWKEGRPFIFCDREKEKEWVGMEIMFIAEQWAVEGNLPKASAFSARKRQSYVLLKMRPGPSNSDMLIILRCCWGEC